MRPPYGHLLSAVTTSSLSGCRPHATGLVARATIPLESYVHSKLAANGRNGRLMGFPTVQVYNASGDLIYQSHDVNENSKILMELQKGRTALPPLAGTMSLSAVIMDMPGINEKESMLAKGSSPTVITISLEGCHACSVLNETLEATQKQIVDSGKNLLLITVQQPS
jgi:hypothetical protein